MLENVGQSFCTILHISPTTWMSEPSSHCAWLLPALSSYSSAQMFHSSTVKTPSRNFYLTTTPYYSESNYLQRVFHHGIQGVPLPRWKSLSMRKQQLFRFATLRSTSCHTAWQALHSTQHQLHAYVNGKRALNSKETFTPSILRILARGISYISAPYKKYIYLDTPVIKTCRRFPQAFDTRSSRPEYAWTRFAWRVGGNHDQWQDLHLPHCQ